MSDVVYIARCPEHGIAGCQDSACFDCGGDAERVAMVEVGWDGLLACLDAVWPTSADPEARVVSLARQLVAERERADRLEAELSEAIPPAYTEHIGHFLLAEIKARGAAA